MTDGRFFGAMPLFFVFDQKTGKMHPQKERDRRAQTRARKTLFSFFASETKKQ